MSRVRNRLCKRLEAAFAAIGKPATFNPNDLDFPKGWYRTSRHADVYRWTAHGVPEGCTNYSFLVDSYDTATLCAANGVTVNRCGISKGWDAHALEPAALLPANQGGDK